MFVLITLEVVKSWLEISAIAIPLVFTTYGEFKKYKGTKELQDKQEKKHKKNVD